MRRARTLPARLRLRRRLLLWSAPVAVLMLLVAVKLFSVVIAGHAAEDHYADGDADALRSDAAVLGIANVVEPAKASFAQGVSAVLDDRLDDADARFAEALERTPAARSCPVRVNLELVRERRGDHAGFDRQPGAARAHYEAALAVVTAAPTGCFADNDDPDQERRAIRADAEARLRAKIAAVADVPPGALPPPPLAPPPPPPPAGPSPDGSTEEVDPDIELRLDPRGADPLERLRQILRDSAG